MSKLIIYGVPASRAFRTYWMAKELGLDYESRPLTREELKSPEYLAVNPNGRMPAISDDGFHLWESMAINLYLARKHGGPLQPKTLQDEARAMQWSFWVMTEVEKHALAIVMQAMASEDKRDPGVVASASQELERPLEVLDGALAKSAYLLGDDFTVADLNVASVLAWLKMGRMDLSPYPHVKEWLDRCIKRPAAVAARG